MELHTYLGVPVSQNKEDSMEEGKEVGTGTQAGSRTCGRRQDYEVRYTAKRTRKSASAVKKAVRKVGSSRKRVVKALERKR